MAIDETLENEEVLVVFNNDVLSICLLIEKHRRFHVEHQKDRRSRSR